MATLKAKIESIEVSEIRFTVSVHCEDEDHTYIAEYSPGLDRVTELHALESNFDNSYKRELAYDMAYELARNYPYSNEHRQIEISEDAETETSGDVKD